MELDGYGAFDLRVMRTGTALMFLAAVFGTFNYLGVQRLMPLCGNPHRALRYLGVLLLDAALVLLVFLCICTLVAFI